MENNIKFSILSYYPNFLNNENINVGILFHNLLDNNIKFIITKNWNRVKVFDDEININFTKDFLQGIADELKSTLFNDNSNFSIKEFTRFYVNQFRFNQIVESKDDDFDNFVNRTYKYFLRQDFEIKDRLCINEQIKYIKQLMRSENIKYSTKKILGSFNENISFDYMVSNYGFKNFTFANKDISRQITTAKAWAYTADKAKDVKAIFTYDQDIEDSKDFEIVMSILKENAYKVLPKEILFEFIQKISSEKCDQRDK